MEEVFARATRFGLAIDLEIHVLENRGVRRERALLGEDRAGGGFFFRGFVDLLVNLFGQHALFDKAALEELNRIVLRLVFLDLLLGTIAALVL